MDALNYFLCQSYSPQNVICLSGSFSLSTLVRIEGLVELIRVQSNTSERGKELEMGQFLPGAEYKNIIKNIQIN